MFSSLPTAASEFMNWDWSKFEPFYRELTERPLNAENVSGWLSDWTALTNIVEEMYARLSVATSQSTADEDARKRYFAFLDNMFPPLQIAAQTLKKKLLDSGLRPAGFDIPLRNMRAEAELFREDNIPLFTEESKLSTQYDEIIGAQTVTWEGQELTLTQLLGVIAQSPDRAVRERAWRLRAERQLADREAINALWVKFMNVRRQIAANAGYSNYRDFRWKQLIRFDYTPEDCKSFQRAIEEVVVPAATRIYQRVGKQLGVSSVRPWDMGRDNIYPIDLHPLHPFQSTAELEGKGAAIFQCVDPQLGGYFNTMRQEHLLDLDNRKNKAPGAYCTSFPVSKRPFIFENAIGVNDDVQTLLHEAGHAFHVFETNHLPYSQQTQVGMEFAEVASMSMELLASPYLPAREGGFYSDQDAAYALVEHLQNLILFWPFMAAVDAFQHWVYENHDAATDPANCDQKWVELWRRFIPGVDWNGLEAQEMTGWHRKLHIHQAPFYYVEYGLAQLGAVQVWRNSLEDQAGAVARYRKALSLGSTVTLPQLYAAAGAKFAFDAATLRMAVDLIESKIEALQPAHE
jgi:oligoendopeptidase F